MDEKPREFINSGCQLLDCVLGGGWPLGRISNVVGDKSVGKTAIFIEAAANFNRQFPDGKIYYLEAESAFDTDYAHSLGFPEGVNMINDVDTVEGLFNTISKVIEEYKDTNTPVLFGVDSLDALSDVAEKEREIDDGSYGAAKAKKLSELFRRLIKEIEKTKIHLMVISQTRDKIGVMFGEKHSRSGGRALDFYATQILWLSEIGKMKKTINKVEKIIGVEIRANCKKNKISTPWRTCDFPYVFLYGVDSISASLEWLKKVKQTEGWENYIKDPTPIYENAKLRKELDEHVKKLWDEIEEKFTPKYSKY